MSIPLHARGLVDAERLQVAAGEDRGRRVRQLEQRRALLEAGLDVERAPADQVRVDGRARRSRARRGSRRRARGCRACSAGRRSCRSGCGRARAGGGWRTGRRSSWSRRRDGTPGAGSPAGSTTTNGMPRAVRRAICSGVSSETTRISPALRRLATASTQERPSAPGPSWADRTTPRSFSRATSSTPLMISIAHGLSSSLKTTSSSEAFGPAGSGAGSRARAASARPARGCPAPRPIAPLTTFETVGTDTPAASAMWAIVTRWPCREAIRYVSRMARNFLGLRVRGRRDRRRRPARPWSCAASGLGGWMNMENFITGYPANESAMREAVAAVLGAGAG